VAKNEGIGVVIWCRGGRVVSRKEERRRECETRKRTKGLSSCVRRKSRKGRTSAKRSLVR
jgi:hypothetical protein